MGMTWRTRGIVAGIVLLISFPAIGETPEECLERGRMLLNQGKREEGMKALTEAVKQLQEAVGKDPKDLSSHLLMGRAYFYMAKDKEALAAFAKVQELDPENAEPHFYRGRILVYGKNLEEAEKAFQTACKLAPKEPKYRFELGRLYARAKQHEKALDAFGKVLAIKPDHTGALYSM
ncbi:MAG: tetratricopeptide repeat protein, partial [Planctomycetota bacterium]